MASGGDQADGVHSNRLKLLEDKLKHFRDRYIELSSKYEFKYLCRRLARWWLHHDEKRVSKRGGTNERPEERLLNNYLLMQAYFLLAIKGLGFLAMMWSTVVLLGGLVTSLHRNDFWCLTVITMIQAARIFDNLQVHLLPSLLNLAVRLFRIRIMPSYPTTANLSDAYFSWFFIQIRDFWSSTVEIVWSLLVLVVNLAVTFVLFLYQLGPLVCSALSWWRIWVHNFGDTGKDDGKANLTPALIIFYALVLLQGAFYLPWQLCDIVHEEVIRSVYRRCRLNPKWGHGVVKGYFLDTRVKCEQEPGSIADSNLVRYAVQLLDSELPDKYLSGARLLDTLIKQGEDIRSLLLLSRPKIQKLIDTLGLRSNTAYNREIRELAARILADLSSYLHLAQFPGTIQCISSLVQTNEPYCKKQNALDDELAFTVGREGSRVISAPCFLGPPFFETTVQRANHKDGKKSYIQYREGAGKELILHGLMILEGLASNQHNCKEICGSPGLIPKITAPIYSSKLIEDMKISGWTDVVNRSLKLLLKLIRSSGRTGRRLRSDLSSQMKAMSNLESIIIDQGNEVDEELQMHAMEILTELAIEPPIHIDRRTEENLITSWMEIFLADGGEGRPGSTIRMTAGRTLAILTKHSEINCVFIIGEFENIIHRLTMMFDAKNNIIYRAIAAKILENLCTCCHETLRKKNVAKTLLSKILTEILCKGQQNICDNEGINTLSGHEDDEENWLPNLGSKRKSSNEENHQHTISNRLLEQLKIVKEVLKIVLSLLVGITQNDNDQCQSSNEGENNTMDEVVRRELQEALLSLILVTYDRMISADGFAATVQEKAPGHGAFVAKLKAIVEDNYQATPTSLRVIKLCCQIAISMMKCRQYTEHFKDQKFIESLSKAIEITSDLEIYMLFTGTNFAAEKTARHLLSDFEKELSK